MNTADNIGERLQRARESRGLSLRDAANRTKLSIDLLTAIERNDFDSLPPGMYRKAYIRTFATEVGLDPNAVGTEYSKLVETSHDPFATEGQTHQDQVAQQLTAPPVWSTKTIALFAVLAAVWFILQSWHVPLAVPDDPTADTVNARAPLESSAFVPVALLPAAITSGLATSAVSIQIQASDWCWVAAEVDGRRVVYRLVKAGERLVIEADRLISLRLGDAGAVTLSINDGESRLAGQPGEVVQFEVTARNALRSEL